MSKSGNAVGTEAAVPPAIEAVCDHFGLGSASGAMPLTAGLMNRNWRVTTATGDAYAVKEILDIDAAQVAFQHRAVGALARRGLPVPSPLVTPAGDSVVRLDGGMFAVARWIDGEHIPGLEWTREQCRQVGQLLGRIHVGLAAALPDGVGPVRPRVLEAARAKADIDRYLGLIGERRRLDEFDVYARDWLAGHRQVLERSAHLRPDDDLELVPGGYVHGDFHALNLLMAGGDVVAVLDWDRMGRKRAYAYELARSVTLLFGGSASSGALDVGRAAAFTGGYRGVVTISDDQIRAAVRHLWWERVCDLWQLHWRYVRGDTSCDHLFLSSSALLLWWSAHLDLVDAALTSRGEA